MSLAFLTLVLTMLSLPAHAINASPHPFTEVQPGGTQITLTIKGDEYFHWLEDTNGFTVVADGEAYYYAILDGNGNLAPSALLVGESDPAAQGLTPHIMPPRANIVAARASTLVAPQSTPDPILPIGTIENIVIMLRFSDHGARTLPTTGNIATLFNAVGGDPILAPTGSVRDVYLENSYGLMTLDSTVVGWVDLPNTEAFYANGQSGLSTVVWQAISDALDLADPLIDFDQFDTDTDNFVDAITFIHSGYGAEWGGTDAFGASFVDRIWSHRWSIPTYTTDEGVNISDYHISPGVWDISGSAIGRIGVICHETGHFFGLPDLYDTDGGGQGIGSYCMMANSWGFTGTQLNPPHFSAWTKIFLGWATPTVISSPGVFSLDAVELNPEIYRIDNDYPSGEYLLVENRQPIGFESTLPQGGLAVWHIDEAKFNNAEEGYPGQPGWPGNNNHYQIALLQADGEYGLEQGFDVGDAGDVYHGGGIDVIDQDTLPSTDRYQSGIVADTDNKLSSISASGNTMSFVYNDGQLPSNTITSNPPAGLIEDGQGLELYAPAGAVGPFQWMSDTGMGLQNVVDDPMNPGRITGMTTNTLVFAPVTLADAGTYVLMYDDGSKAPVTSAPFTLSVLPAGALPGNALWAIVVLSTGCIVVGARKLVRQQRR